jgi:hypothetical protein
MVKKAITAVVLVEASLAQARTNRLVSVCLWSFSGIFANVTSQVEIDL